MQVAVAREVVVDDAERVDALDQQRRRRRRLQQVVAVEAQRAHLVDGANHQALDRVNFVVDDVEVGHVRQTLEGAPFDHAQVGLLRTHPPPASCQKKAAK